MRPLLTAIVFSVLFLPTGAWAAAARPVVLVTPAGGEFYIIGSQQRVRLDPKTRSKSVQLELSRDGGTTFTALGTIDNLVKDKTLRNVFSFTVTAPASALCVIRATADGVSSTSSGFSIGTAATANATPLTADQISSGTASVGTILSSDGNGGTSFTPLSVTSGQINSGAASNGNVLVSDGSGGSAFQSLNGTFVRVAGDNMTGALNVSGNVGVGTTTPRGKLEVADPTSAILVLSGGNGDYMQWRASSTSFVHEYVTTGGSTSPVGMGNFANGSFRYGALTGSGAFTAQGDNSVSIDGAFSFEAINRTADFTANDSTCVFFCNSASNNITITLPDAATRIGRIYFIKKTSANNNVTIAPLGGDTIDGAANVVMAANNSVRFLMSNGTNWFVISSQ